MADSLLVILNRNDIGSPLLWNSLLEESSIKVQISEDFDPLVHDGFVQCLFEGKRAGFEFELSPIDSFDFEQEFIERFPQNSYVLSLTPRDGYKSALSATSIAAAISTISNGKVLEEDDSLVEAAKAITWAQNSIQEYKEFEAASTDAKKEVRRIKKSQEKIRFRLQELLSSAIGLKPKDAVKADVYLGLVFKLNQRYATFRTNLWEFGYQEDVVQLSSELLESRFRINQAKASKFFPILEEALDEECKISEASINAENTIILKLTNGYFFKCYPKEELGFSSEYLNFTIYEGGIDIYT